MRRPPGRLPRSRAQVIDALASNFVVDPDTNCWLWTGPLNPDGYAALKWSPGDGRRYLGGHRVVMRALGLPLPDGLVIDHLCRTRRCINPDHLELVTNRENVVRSSITLATVNLAKTHCPSGHPYSPENTYVWANRAKKTVERRCRTCKSAYASRARKAVSA